MSYIRTLQFSYKVAIRMKHKPEIVYRADAPSTHSLAAGPYKDTVNLPQTKFNMRANSKQREPELQRFWAKEKVYEGLSRNNPGEPFTLHDGPPYANGDLHCGHALNKVPPSVQASHPLVSQYCL